ncbi:MAG TPA: sugar ABC transporter permease [Actinopolymorphaceae bacterium]
MAQSFSAGVAATRRSRSRLGLLFVAPTFLIVAVFFLFPLGSAVYFALTDWDGVSPTPRFVAADNFLRMVGDKEVWHALGNNLIWVLVGTTAPIVLGLLLAVVLWSGVRAVLFYRLVFFMPYVLPPIAVGIVWSWIYDPINGWLNRLLTLVGLGEAARGWLGEPDSALYAVLAAAIWATFGFVVVIFLAALQNVDLDLIDAARIDGANAARRLWHVILPQIVPVFFMVTAITFVGGISVFDIVFIMTGGGPGNATSVLGTYAFKNAFQLNDIGYGTALALLITVLSLPCVMILNRVQRALAKRGMGD